MAISVFHPQNDCEFFRPATTGSDPPRDSLAVDVPVVIIGGGPAGLFQAYLLSQLGGNSFRNRKGNKPTDRV